MVLQGDGHVLRHHPQGAAQIALDSFTQQGIETRHHRRGHTGRETGLGTGVAQQLQQGQAQTVRGLGGIRAQIVGGHHPPGVGQTDLDAGVSDVEKKKLWLHVTLLGEQMPRAQESAGRKYARKPARSQGRAAYPPACRIARHVPFLCARNHQSRAVSSLLEEQSPWDTLAPPLPLPSGSPSARRIFQDSSFSGKNNLEVIISLYLSRPQGDYMNPLTPEDTDGATF